MNKNKNVKGRDDLAAPLHSTLTTNSHEHAATLRRIVDEHIIWLQNWHGIVFGMQGADPNPLSLRPPKSFAQWYKNAAQALGHELHSADRVAVRYDHMHKLARMMLRHAAPNPPPPYAEYHRFTQAFIDMMASMRELERRLTMCAAGRDVTTGLRSRTALVETLLQAWAYKLRSGEHFSIAIMNPDRFGEVNALYGEDVGDRALTHLGGIAQQYLRASDDIFRHRDSNFMILLRGGSDDKQVEALSRLSQQITLATMPLPGGQQLTLSASFGIAGSHQAENLDQLLHLAEGACLSAKARGRNSVHRA